MEQRELGEIAKGLAKFRQQVKQPKLDATNPFFKSGYLTLTGLQDTIDAALKDTGLSYVQLVATTESGLPGVRTVILHTSGQMMMSEVLTLKPSRNDPQGMGSAITYAKRYQLAAIFGISGEKDDDGNAASQPRQQQRNYPQNQQNYQHNGNQGGF